MSLGEPSAAIMFFGAFSVFAFIMLLPAIIELKRPKDAGPRTIIEKVRVDLEIPVLEGDRSVLDQSVLTRIRDVIAVLPNLEV